VLGCGIVGLLFLCVSVGFLHPLFLDRPMYKSYRTASIIFSFLSAFFIILGGFLYARKIDLYYSFIMFIGCGFLLLAATAGLTIGLTAGMTWTTASSPSSKQSNAMPPSTT